MNPEWIIRGTQFEGCTATFEDAHVVLVGAGYDGTSSYRSGSRFAPAALRSETLLSQENYSPYFQQDLSDLKIHDLGNLDLPFGNKTGALGMIWDTASFLFANGKVPCFIGGEHLITLPVFQAAVAHHPGLHLLQLDAHLDLADELFGEGLSHGTVMRRCLEEMGERGRLYQGGIRSGSRDEFLFAESHTRLFPFGLNDMIPALNELAHVPVYLTLDLDVFDPALIPGTGTPEAGGIFFGEFMRFLRAIQGLNIVGFDIVELAPKIDPTGASTIVASKIVRELLIACSSSQG